LTPFCFLLVVQNHYGGVHGGHYVSFCKNFKDDNWYCFDDSKAFPIQREEVVSSNAYLLFYISRPPVEMPLKMEVKKWPFTAFIKPSGN
jgi:ubiquitin C-terminal hydrolase